MSVIVSLGMHVVANFQSSTILHTHTASAFPASREYVICIWVKCIFLYSIRHKSLNPKTPLIPKPYPLSKRQVVAIAGEQGRTFHSS